MPTARDVLGALNDQAAHQVPNRRDGHEHAVAHRGLAEEVLQDGRRAADEAEVGHPHEGDSGGVPAESFVPQRLGIGGDELFERGKLGALRDGVAEEKFDGRNKRGGEDGERDEQPAPRDDLSGEAAD
nr:hypothetical protein [Corynebacterium massiliense]